MVKMTDIINAKRAIDSDIALLRRLEAKVKKYRELVKAPRKATVAV